MKINIKLSCLLIVLFISTNFAYSQDQEPPIFGPGFEPNPGGHDDLDQGDGAKGTPIDDYLPILIISAVAIAGLYSYKERKIIKK